MKEPEHDAQPGDIVLPSVAPGRLAGPHLSVVMPVYNERATIEEILLRVCAVSIDKEIIIVDDGSTDGSRELLAKLATRDDHTSCLLYTSPSPRD